MHALIYSDDAPATRAFLRDVLRFGFVVDRATDEGWLIFGTGPSELGVHPTRSEWEGKVYEAPRHHQLTFMCDDLASTRLELEGRGATLVGDEQDEGWGITIMLEVPGADPIMLYQPKHPTAIER
jgi:hypothetical protein